VIRARIALGVFSWNFVDRFPLRLTAALRYPWASVANFLLLLTHPKQFGKGLS